MKKGKIIIELIAILVVIVLIGVVGFGYYKKATENKQNPMVTMEVKDLGTIKLELYPDKAPNTVANEDGANKLANLYKKPPVAPKPEPSPLPETVKSLN